MQKIENIMFFDKTIRLKIGMYKGIKSGIE
jgi:hypothetical protein